MNLEPIGSLEEFLAHALAIESEAAIRYREYQAYFTDHGEDVLAGLCNNLAHFEQQHFDELVERSKGLTLPVIAADGYRWLDGRSPESTAHDVLYRIASPRQLLEIALLAEHRARTFFEWVAQSVTDPQVARMAAEMAKEEDEHVGWVSRALEYLPSGDVDWGPLLDKGGGPGLALGEERRWHRAATPPKP
jgi:rubrerythrin